MQAKANVVEYWHGEFVASCQLLPNSFFSASTRKIALSKLVTALQARGLTGTLKVENSFVAKKLSAQETYFLAYRAAGGIMPLDMYLNH